ncbi:MAG: response regulator [Alphaproteobacteria bacterium]|nr:response regulator [Alphaproteobacteria bacterium SS10]
MESIERYDLRPLKVLVIDDEPAMLEIVKGLLTRCGVGEVKTSSDAAMAFEQMRYNVPDIILVDWEMEPLDGGDFLRLVRQDTRFQDRDIGLFIITGFPEEWRVNQAIRAGADDFIAKPISTAGVKGKLIRYIDRKREDLQQRCLNPRYLKLTNLESQDGKARA